MNRSELIDTLKDRVIVSRKEAEQLVDIFFGSITNTLLNDERVEIRGFGSFTVKKYKPYIGRNPKSGSKIQVPSKRLPFFKVGKELKELVDNQH